MKFKEELLLVLKSMNDNLEQIVKELNNISVVTEMNN